MKILPKNAITIPPQAECVFKGQIYDVYQWQQEMFDGSFATFEMLKRPDTIEVIAIKDGNIVLNEEQQPGSNIYYSVPGGRHDVEGETELQAAKRELLEETGMSFASWRLLSVTQPHGKTEYFKYVFLAQEFIGQTNQQLDNGEKINVLLQSLEQVQRKMNQPDGRYIPKEVLAKYNSIEDLANAPEYTQQTTT